MSNFVPNVTLLRIHVHASKLGFRFSHYILYHIIGTHTPFQENCVDNNTTTTRVAIVLKMRIKIEQNVYSLTKVFRKLHDDSAVNFQNLAFLDKDFV